MKKYRVLYGVVVIFALIFSMVYSGNFSFILLVSTLALPFVSLLIQLAVLLFTKVDFSVTNHTYRKNELFKATVRVSNRTPFALSTVVIKACMPSIDPLAHMSELILSVKPFHCERLHLKYDLEFRGTYEFSLNELVCYDFLHLFRLKKRLKLRKDIIVLPRHFMLEEIETKSYGKIENPLLLVNDSNGSEQNFIRQYKEGDAFHNIHWKMSAKQDDYMVRQMASGANTGVSLFCDLSVSSGDILKNAAIADKCVEIAVALTFYTMRNGENVVNYFYNAVPAQAECSFTSNETDFDRLLYVYAQARIYSSGPSLTELAGMFLETTKDASTAIFITPCVTEELYMTLKDLSMIVPRTLLIKTSDQTSEKVSAMLSRTPGIECCDIQGDDIANSLNVFLHPNRSIK